MEDQIVLISFLGVLCFGAVMFAVLAPTKKDKANKRLNSIGGGRASGRSASSGGQSDANSKERRKRVAESLNQLESKTKELKKKKPVSIEQRLDRAGLPISSSQFYMVSAGIAVLFGAIGFVSGQQLWVTGLLTVVGGLGFPRWVVGFLTGRRQKKFANEFSTSIDVIVRGVKSGLPVNECLKIIANEAPKPVCEEFHILVEGMRVGLSLEQALERMYDRMPLQEVNFFGIVLVIQQNTGGNLAEALGNLSNVLRARKLMEGKIKALSSEAKASAMIIGSLPFLVAGAVKMASPDYLDPLFNTQTGNFVLLGAGVWMTMGIFVMKKMTMIKV